MFTCPYCAAPLEQTWKHCSACGAALTGGSVQTPGSSAALAPQTGLQGGRYLLEHVLGQGGFGITYAALDTQLGRPVALKECFPAGSSRSGLRVSVGNLEFEVQKKTFLEEGRVLARFQHPGIVRVFDVFEENDTAYLVTSLLEGETLAGRLERRGKLVPDEVKSRLEGILSALAEVHRAGLLHRDLKPDNLFCVENGRTVLIDFGSARAFQLGRTVAHTRVLTAQYAPPEQWSSEARFGPYTDFYALGATFYHALSGTPPTSAPERMMNTPLVPLEHTPPILRDTLERMLRLGVRERPQSAHDVLELLSRAHLPRGAGPRRLGMSDYSTDVCQHLPQVPALPLELNRLDAGTLGPGALGTLEPMSKTTRFYGRWAALMVAVLFFGQYVLNPSSYTLIDFANLAIHEGGHLVFRILGEFVYFLGGSLMQILLPLAFCFTFWRGRQRFSAALCLFWVSNNLFSVSTYIKDARTMRLELVGGDTHDWNWILGQLNALGADQILGGFVYALGLCVYLLALGAGIFLLLKPGVLERASSSVS